MSDKTIELLKQTCLRMFQALALTVESRDPYSRGHSERVALLSRELAQELGCSDELKFEIEIAARIHDIGKLGIRDEILLSPEPLTPAEWLEMMQHPSKGADIVRPLDFLPDLPTIIEGHHEHYDGAGYPKGLKGADIPLGARILAVADAYDALTSERFYRPRFSHEQAIEMLRSGAGMQWDPKVVDAFLKVAENKKSITWI